MKKNKKCAFEGCTNKDTMLVHIGWNSEKKQNEFVTSCDIHYEQFLRYGCEYIHHCPNCGCISAIN